MKSALNSSSFSYLGDPQGLLEHFINLRNYFCGWGSLCSALICPSFTIGCTLSEARINPNIKTGPCTFRQTKLQPVLPLVSGGVGCGVWQSKKHSMQGEAGGGRCAGMTLADGYNLICGSSPLGYRWTRWHLNVDSSDSWSTSSNTFAAALLSSWEFNGT